MGREKFVEKLPLDRGLAPAPFTLDLRLWLGPMLVPAVAIEQSMRMAVCREAEHKEKTRAIAPPRPSRRPGIIATWRRRRHFRRELARLLIDCPHIIPDIGLTFEAAEAEVARPFWRAYRHERPA